MSTEPGQDHSILVAMQSGRSLCGAGRLGGGCATRVLRGDAPGRAGPASSAPPTSRTPLGRPAPRTARPPGTPCTGSRRLLTGRPGLRRCGQGRTPRDLARGTLPADATLAGRARHPCRFRHPCLPPGSALIPAATSHRRCQPGSAVIVPRVGAASQKCQPATGTMSALNLAHICLLPRPSREPGESRANGGQGRSRSERAVTWVYSLVTAYEVGRPRQCVNSGHRRHP
jgi:hypothetical protein